MKTKRVYLVILPAIAAVMLVTSCVPRGAAVNVVSTDDTDVGAIDRSEAVAANSSPSDIAASQPGEIVDREPYATRTPMSLAVPTSSPTPEPTSSPAEAESSAGADKPAEPDAADGASPVHPANAASAPASQAPAAATIGGALVLARVEDVDPAPPFLVRVDGVRLVDGGETYRVTGWIRNDGAVTYEGIGLEATFYDGSDWHFGPFDATCGCYSLAPGQSCAFTAEAYARDYTGYRLHPGGSPLKAWTGSPIVLTVRDVVVAGNVAGYVHLTGFVKNQTGSAVTAVRVSAALLDSHGAVTGVGTTIVAGKLAPGAEVSFSLRVPADIYASYTVTAEAELQ
ncbi:MAG: hypothetical protein J7M39_08090 [Anaerolineae bacterium]|nr:hypothetical protein [Anaerolineae bacterium]